jgi:hypothetical protein
VSSSYERIGDMDKAYSEDYEEKLLAELERFQEHVFGIAGDGYEGNSLTWIDS